jgi:hypothetical protein
MYRKGGGACKQAKPKRSLTGIPWYEDLRVLAYFLPLALRLSPFFRSHPQSEKRAGILPRNNSEREIETSACLTTAAKRAYPPTMAQSYFSPDAGAPITTPYPIRSHSTPSRAHLAARHIKTRFQSLEVARKPTCWCGRPRCKATAASTISNLCKLGSG